MKQDKLILIIQYFFRIFSWSFIPASIISICLIISFVFSKDFILNILFKGKNLLAIPTTIPTSIFITLTILIFGGVISFMLYHLIANLIRDIRVNKINVSIIKKLKTIALLFIISFIIDVFFYVSMSFASDKAHIFHQVLGLIGPIIDWYNFIYVEFTGITSLAMFFLTTFLARFLEYHFELKGEQDLTV